MKQANYYLNDEGAFIIENYHRAKPFSSFLPAVAGLHGKPLWLYYVNRGQCISTFGINNKNYAMLEFQPANKAYRQTNLQGFRTFLKIKNVHTGETFFYEPFQDNLSDRDEDITQKMMITSYDVRLEEVNESLGLKCEVMFCTLPGERLASLVRSLTITNISDRMLEIEVVDGLPAIIPYYINDADLKNMSNLFQAWMTVEHHQTFPFYKIKALPADTPETVFVEGGNFYINVSFQNGDKIFARTIVEPQKLFGSKTDFSWPENFMREDFIFPEEQVTVGITPCGFGCRKLLLAAKQCHTAYTLAGSSDNYESVVRFALEELTESYLKGKIEENINLIEGLKSPVRTKSALRNFDLYAGQSFLDNFLRGGYPINVGKGRHAFYVYSRKHGDPEREYNFFQVDSTYYSQGNANFRDVNQNRRNDVCFFPFIGDSNVRTFFNLIQMDGFNPLVIKGSRFMIEDFGALNAILDRFVHTAHRQLLIEYLKKPFTPGLLLGFMEHKGIALRQGNSEEFLDEVLHISQKEDLADFQEGYWVDHWLYNTDLLEQYLAVFPDKAGKLFLEDNSFTWYDNYEMVLPRRQKYVLSPNGVRQLGAVVPVPEKLRLIQARASEPFKVRTRGGKGDIYHCNLLTKIVILILNKIASLDPEGVGVEMEANKPGWCDALNGLPALLGSSVNESAAIKRLALMTLDTLERLKTRAAVKLPEEVFAFFSVISTLLSKKTDGLEYWEISSTAKEAYRQKIFFGINGPERETSMESVMTFLKNVIDKIDRGFEKAFNRQDGIYYTYFINEVTEYEELKDDSGHTLKDKNGYAYVKPLRFRQRPIPYFLEGLVHILRMEKDVEKARALYHAIRKSGLYDEKLRMYKVNDCIMEETKEIGRQNIFPRGWLENEAVFLHMEYKYLLELLRCGLIDEYMESFKNALIPFLDPKVYGRSILENSSFIVSSVHPDKNIHGQGFVSRLTGASAEFLTMWLFMTSGQKPFFLDADERLCLELKPVLPRWLFDDEGRFGFNFLGSVWAVYHNAARKNTYGEDGAKIRQIVLFEKNEAITIEGSIIRAPYAQRIRDGLVKRMEITLE